MKYTSAEANKLIKKIEDRIRLAAMAETKASVFFAASGEDAESLRPKYDFAESQAKMEALESQLRKVKHAVNCFNITHSLPGFNGLTVDQALVLIPQLRARTATLRDMVNRLPKERVDNSFRNSSIIDYSIINYDLEEVRRKYDEMCERLSALQLALDTLNTTQTMDIDVVLE